MRSKSWLEGNCAGLEVCGLNLVIKLNEMGRLCRSGGKQTDLMVGGSFGYGEKGVQVCVGVGV